MWIKGNYRRNLMDMHIDDWNPEFLSKINVKEYVEALKDAGVQAAMVKGKPHTGLCYYPTKVGRMHRGLKGYDFFGDMVKTCHENGIIIKMYLQTFRSYIIRQDVIRSLLIIPPRRRKNADFTEAILNSTFDWEGKRAPYVFATENDNLNGLSMVFGNLLTGKVSGFSDVRCYWSPEAVERVTGWKPEGSAKEGFIHLINSGSTCLDATGKSKDAQGNAVMKPWWEMTEEDIEACLIATSWCPAELCQFRGGGYSSRFKTDAEMPLTMVRINLVEGVGPVMQIAEGKSITLPEDVHKKIDDRTDPTWPTTWFVPRTTGEGAFRDVYSVMANWGANHGAFIHGHMGADLITLASMLRIPVVMHNVEEERIFRPHAWGSFGTRDTEAADMAACKAYGPLYG